MADDESPGADEAEVDDSEARAEAEREAKLTVHQFDPALSYGGEPEYNDGTEVERADGPGVEGEPTPGPRQQVRLIVPEGADPVVVDASNAMDDPGELEPGERDGLQAPTAIPVGARGEGAALQHPVEKGNQEGRIGVVERTLTPLGEEIGIDHGVINHELTQLGIEPSGEPIMRCPQCGNVNIALHNRARTSAHCPSCLWQSSNLRAEATPEGKVPGVHEADGTFAQAGEVPKGKLDGALGMDPQEAKEGVETVDLDAGSMGEVTSFHMGEDGQPIKQSKRMVE